MNAHDNNLIYYILLILQVFHIAFRMFGEGRFVKKKLFQTVLSSKNEILGIPQQDTLWYQKATYTC